MSFRPPIRTICCRRQVIYHVRKPQLRFTNSSSSSSPTSKAQSTTTASRIDRIHRRLPSYLHKYTSALAAAPVSHITSFLILHELTAIIPLLGLAATFHYTHWLPVWFSEGKWVMSGVQRFGRYFEKKGWINGGEASEAERGVSVAGFGGVDVVGEDDGEGKVVAEGKGGRVRLVVEFATAYAVVKMLLVPRIVFCVWATPGFARWTVVPIVKMFRR